MTKQDVLFPPRIPQVNEHDDKLWNWARNSSLGVRDNLQVAHSESELQTLVSGCNGIVRAIGNRMSAGRMLALEDKDSLLIDVSPLSGLISHTSTSATFGGGTSLHEVFKTLTQMGRMLHASPGVISAQSLAGAISTGTHGQGLHQSSLSDDALAIRFVDAWGCVHEWQHTHPQFGALQVGLGTLGIITAVTLRTRSDATFTCFKQATSAQNLEQDILCWNYGWAYSKAWWFPDEDKVHVWNSRQASEEEHHAWLANHQNLVMQEKTSSAMNHTIDNTLNHMRNDTHITDNNGKPFRTVTRFKDFSDVTGDIYQVFCRGIATPQINIEIGVPLADAPQIISLIKTWHARERPHLHYPIILRATGPGKGWLSPAYGSDTLFFGFVVYYAADGSLAPAGLEFLSRVERLLAQHGGRPHWGKYFHPELYEWQTRYPRWAEFQTLRRELDPAGKFSNVFCREILK